MGSGASCEGRSSTPLDERLRTMLILRAYNCRPRDWTMKDQFDAVAENGVLTKDLLRKALQLSEYPRIEALLDRCLLDPVDSSTGSVGSFSVEALIAFVEAGSRNLSKINPAVSGGPHNQNPPPPPAIHPAAKPSVELQAARSHQTSGASDHARTYELITAAADDASPTTGVDEHAGSDKLKLLSPRVVPLTSKSELLLSAAAAAAADPKSAGTSASARGERKGVLHKNSSSSSSGFGSEESKGERNVDDLHGKSGGSSASRPARDELCTTLVSHLGTVLGPRGKDAHRRPGPCQPVWRKRETLIQERIVQYTTVDEQGTVQELFETEKSQTEVLHMECKRTGEFAHSESTHYESGETFNGEVVLEEAGVERYVHLRSVDDEYEHLESSLPPRARHGAAGAGPTRAGSEDCDKISETNEGGGDSGAERREEGNGNYAGDADAQERCDINDEDRDGRGAAWQESDFLGGVEIDREAPPPFAPPGGTEITPDDAEGNDADTAQGGYPGIRCAFGDGRYPSPSTPSLHHYRSPSCSPRLSPRPARSPYRQEGVGGKESSGRGPSRRSVSPSKSDHQNTPTHVSGRDTGVGHDEACLGWAEKVSGGAGDSGVDTSPARTNNQGGEASARPRVVGSDGATPRTAPIRLEGAATCSDVDEVQTEEVSDDDARLDLQQCDTTRFRQSIAEPDSGIQPPWVDTLEGLFAGTDGYGDGGCREGVGREEPLNSGSCGYSESAVFFGNHSSGRGEDGEYCRGTGEEWRRTDSGSALRGVEFSFGRDDTSMVLEGDRQVDVPPALAEKAADGTSPIPWEPQQVDPGLAGSSGTDDDIPNLIEGLRADASPAISASSGEAQVERRVEGENFREQQRRGSGVEGSRPGGAAKSEPSPAPAPFHNDDWGMTTSP